MKSDTIRSLIAIWGTISLVIIFFQEDIINFSIVIISVVILFNCLDKWDNVEKEYSKRENELMKKWLNRGNINGRRGK